MKEGGGRGQVWKNSQELLQLIIGGEGGIPVKHLTALQQPHGANIIHERIIKILVKYLDYP
jgi:hypothetical protein